MQYLELLKSQFNNRIDIRLKRPGIHQLILPLFHEDGDMVDVFLEESPSNNGRIRIADYGMTLMRLSYSFELSTPKREEILQRILSENHVLENGGTLYMDVGSEDLYPSILQFAQVLARVSNMRLFRKEVIQSLFFEYLTEIVETRLSKFNPIFPFFPLPNNEEYEVDFCFNHSPKPVYLFGVDSPKTANLATISCLKFANEKINFNGAIVFESLEKIGKKDIARLMSVADKNFPSLDDFKENGSKYLDRELRA